MARIFSVIFCFVVLICTGEAFAANGVAARTQARKQKAVKILPLTADQVRSKCTQNGKKRGLRGSALNRYVRSCRGTDLDGVSQTAAKGNSLVAGPDNCPSDFNYDQADGDTDGVGNVCDNCASTANLDQSDSDGDGVGNACDNCSSLANADQADTDNDGDGNLCDNCVSDANKNQEDGDTDGVGDACEIVDLVFGDSTGSKVFVYYDARTGGPVKEASVELNSATSKVVTPTNVHIGENALIVSNLDDPSTVLFDPSVTIYEDFSTLTTNQAPDTILDNVGSGIVQPDWLLAADGDLAVADRGNDDVRIFRDVNTLVSGQAPDAILNGGGSGIIEPVHLYLDGSDRLFVSNFGALTDNSDDKITVYNNFSALTTGQAPAITLDPTTSKIANPHRLFIDNNRLYVIQEEPGEGSILIFDNASALTTNQAPEVVLLGGLFALEDPEGFGMTGGRLWVSDGDEDAPGLKGWDSPASLTSSSLPDVFVSSYLSDANDLRALLGSLFVVSENFNAVMIYKDASEITEDQIPDIFLVDSNASDAFVLDAKGR